MKLWVYVGLVVLSGLFLAVALAHDAPSGHPYPPICCSPENDRQLCHPIDCEEVTEYNGSYHWQGLHFDKTRTFASFDDQCHTCNTVSSDGKPDFGYCILLRQTAWQDNLNRWARMYERGAK